MSELVIDPSLAPAAEPVIVPSTEPLVVSEPDATEPVVEEVAAEPEVAAPEPEKKHHGAVAELIQNRRELKDTRERLAQVEADIRSGKYVPAPPPVPAADLERQHLEAVAKRLNLYIKDANDKSVPDLEAAKSVDGYVRDVVRSTVAPMQQMTLQDRAQTGINELWAQMQEQKIAPEAVAFVDAEVRSLMAMPNGAQLLAQPEVLDTVYERALGKAFRAGKLTGAPPAPKKAAAEAIVSPPGGKRGAVGAAVQLSPAVAALYASHGMDPTKTRSATQELKTDKTGAIELES